MTDKWELFWIAPLLGYGVFLLLLLSFLLLVVYLVASLLGLSTTRGRLQRQELNDSAQLKPPNVPLSPAAGAKEGATSDAVVHCPCGARLTNRNARCEWCGRIPD